jgi:predicted O-methyltransferase YrrM
LRTPGEPHLQPLWPHYAEKATKSQYRVFPFVQKSVQQMMDNNGEVAVTFENRNLGVVTHFYHFVVNAALPLFVALANMPPNKWSKLKVRVPDAGGTLALLPDVFPGVKFIPDASVPCQTATGPSSPWGNAGAASEKRLLVLGSFSCEAQAQIGYPVGALMKQQYAVAAQTFGNYVRTNHHVSTVGNGMLFVSRGVMKAPTEREPCSGSCRRNIANEPELTGALKSWAAQNGRVFAVENFENLPFHDQVVAVAKSRLLIGQHGAGLIHCMWMPVGALVQIKGLTIAAKDVFSNMCGDVVGHRMDNFLVHAQESVGLKALPFAVPVAPFMAWFEQHHGQKGVAMTLDTDPLRSEHAALIKPYLPLKMGYATSASAQADQYAALVADSTVKTICETGFNAGHSALLFLHANPHARLISFDLGKLPVTNVVQKWMKEKFCDRFEFVKGDSVHTVPQYFSEHPDVHCDFVSVDGGRSVSEVEADISNFAASARSGAVVAVDDTPCSAEYCKGPTTAWDAALTKDTLVPLDRVKISSDRGFSVATFK